MEKLVHFPTLKLKLISILPIFLLLCITLLSKVKCDEKLETASKGPPHTCGKLDVVPTDIRSFAPWTVAIFRRVGNLHSRWKFHTSGTIFSSALVLSNQVGPVGRFQSDNDPRNFLIVAGVNTSDFSKHDQFAQYSRVVLILPQKTLYESFFHYVYYYLATPLSFTAPFVKAHCPITSAIVAEFSNPKNQFTKNLLAAAQEGSTFPFPVSGFASRRIGYRNGTKNTSRKEWTLKIWKGVSLSSKTCASIFRFHYGQSLSPFCFRRTVDNATSFLSGDHILQKLELPSEYSRHDDDLCLSHGSRVNLFIGGTWFIGIAVTAIPGQRWRKDGFKTVYFGTFSLQNAKELILNGKWMTKIEQCGDFNFPCASFNSNQCIPLNRTCDNIPDCEDESDEHPDICFWKTGRPVGGDVKSVEMKMTLDLDPRDLARRCPDFEFGLHGVRCIDPETLEDVSCTSPFFYGRRIMVECDRFYRAPKYSFDHMDLFCNFDGQWEGLRPIFCKKECGILSTKDNLIKNFPWEVTVIENGVETCGGTLIQPTFVLTDESCVKNWIESPEARSTFQISLAYDDISSVYDKTAKFLIKNSWVARISEDAADKFENKVALIQLGAPVEKNGVDLNKTMAACFLLSTFNMIHSEQEATIEKGNFVVVSTKNMDAEAPKNFYFTSSLNQSFAGNKTGMNSFAADKIGAGLFFHTVDRITGEFQYFLQGIHSGATKDGQEIFKSVDSHADWILDILETNSYS